LTARPAARSTKRSAFSRRAVLRIVALMVALGLIAFIALDLLLPLLAHPALLDNHHNIGRLLAAGSEDDSFCFVVIGDNHGNRAVYTRLLEQARANRPAFILHTGDHVQNGLSLEYLHYANWIAPYRELPIIHVPGNHTLITGTWKYTAFCGPRNWCFDYGGCRFIGLDNACSAFSEDTLAFAEQHLGTSHQCFIAFHVPLRLDPWSSKSVREGGGTAELMALIESADTRMVFSGHRHVLASQWISATEYLISGGGGGHMYEKEWALPKAHGFAVVTVRDGQAHFNWELLDED